jgi:2-keto-3-deoxy-L-rhamnonate aldolase RhmA
MNSTERKMVEILKKGKNEFGVVSVKAEFEAEGTRIDELLRLLEITRTAGLEMTVKIGGCEAIRDLLESKQIGVRYIVAPMIETAYAASKYINAKEVVYSTDEQKDIDFLFNIETLTTFNNREEIFKEITQFPSVDGIVFGRVDFVGSLGWPRNRINSQEITNYVLEIARFCKENDKQLVMGGGVSIESLDAIRQVYDIRLDRFETRKVVFDTKAALNSDIEYGLLNAVQFELFWLINKKEYYSSISHEDLKRIDMLQLRHSELNTWYKNRKKV